MTAESMNIVVKGKNVQVTPALRDYGTKRANKLRKFFPDDIPMSVDIMLSLERERQIAEVTVHVQGLLIRGESRTEDMYASIDASTDRVERQLRRHKTRLQRRFQGQPKLGELEAYRLADEREADAEAYELPDLVRRKRFGVKPMSLDEAVMQMELVGHDFFVFTNSDTEQVNVVYRRKDGNVGLLEPDYA